MQASVQTARAKTAGKYAVDPNGPITIDDGIDVAIWKTMKDGKWRTAKEVATILFSSGMEYAAVVRRFQSMTHSRHWFDGKPSEKNGQGDPAFALKKGVKCPIGEGQCLMTLATTPKDNKFVSALKGKLEQTFASKTNQTAPAAAAPDAAPVKPAASEQGPEINMSTPLSQAKLIQIVPEDDNRVAVFKLMIDRKWRSREEVANEIMKIDQTRKKVSVLATLSYFHTQADLVELRIGPHDTIKRYQLKENAVMPDQKLPRRIFTDRKQPGRTKKADSKQKDLKLDSSEEAVLFECTIKIRGQVFTYSEVQRLAGELAALGFHKPTSEGSSQSAAAIVQMNQTVRIKGMDFTREDLVELYQQIKQAFPT